MISAEQCSPSAQRYHSRVSHVVDRGRKEGDVENGSRSITAIGRRVDGLISTLELQSLPSEISRCRLPSKDKWESLHEVGSHDVNSSCENGRMAGNSVHQFLLSDCRQFLSSGVTSHQRFKSLESRLGIWDEEDNSPRNLPMILEQIPQPNQVEECLAGYYQSCGWIHRLLHWPSFRVKVSQMLSRENRLSYCNQSDIHWLAVLFAACGLGLWAGDLFHLEQYQDTGLPQKTSARRRLALSWLRCATSALVLGNYDQEPSLDSLRTTSLLLCFPLYFSDEPSMDGAMELIMQTINLARQLKLDVDPDDLPGFRLKSEMAKDERRRLMVAILCQEFQLGGLFCKKWYFEPPSQFALKMPKQLYDEEPPSHEAPGSIMDSAFCESAVKACETTELDGVVSRYKVGQIWQLIGISFSGKEGPLAHERVLELDQQLLNVEKGFPSALKTTFEPHRCVLHPPPRPGSIVDMDRLSTHIVLASAHIRLHRPFVIPRMGLSKAHQEWHRRRILHYGRYILSVNESDHLPLLKHLSMSFVVIAAGIALTVLLITPTSDEEDLMSLRHQVHHAYRTYQNTTCNSSNWHHCYKLLGVLLETDNHIRQDPHSKINLALLESILH